MLLYSTCRREGHAPPSISSAAPSSPTSSNCTPRTSRRNMRARPRCTHAAAGSARFGPQLWHSQRSAPTRRTKMRLPSRERGSRAARTEMRSAVPSPVIATASGFSAIRQIEVSGRIACRIHYGERLRGSPTHPCSRRAFPPHSGAPKRMQQHDGEGTAPHNRGPDRNKQSRARRPRARPRRAVVGTAARAKVSVEHCSETRPMLLQSSRSRHNRR